MALFYSSSSLNDDTVQYCVIKLIISNSIAVWILISNKITLGKQFESNIRYDWEGITHIYLYVPAQLMNLSSFLSSLDDNTVHFDLIKLIIPNSIAVWILITNKTIHLSIEPVLKNKYELFFLKYIQLSTRITYPVLSYWLSIFK